MTLAISSRRARLALLGGAGALAVLVIAGVVAGALLPDAPRTAGAPADRQNPPAASAAIEPTVAAPPGPSFDIVRVEPTGDAVIAGRAAPGAEVAIIDGDKEIGRVTADKRGEWVYLSERPLAPGSRELGLRATNADGSTAEAETSVALVVPEEAGGPVVAVTVGKDGGRLIQGMPTAALGDGPSIAAVSTIAEGHVTISGSAPPGAAVNAYVDGAFVGSGRAGEGGDWYVTAEVPLDPGQHVVRADQVDGAGAVVARAEADFEPQAFDGDQSATVVVAPGNSLWRIARARYGAGMQYTVIYEANKNQIRDPDLIYPGQVFTLPPVETAETG